jgi:hypothetical protein
MMVDELCHANLLKYGHVSWHEPEIKYNWKYWDPVKLVLDHGYDPDVHVHQYSLPVEYGSTVFNLIAESSDRAPFITEKTCTAIFFKKPFIVFGAPGFHQGLKKLGFELYDELFDYSFDIIKDDKLRLYKILQTIDRLKNQDYDMLRQSVIEKTERNYIHAIEIVTSRKYVPEFMLSYLEVLKQNPSLIIHPRDNRYLALGQLFKS